MQEQFRNISFFKGIHFKYICDVCTGIFYVLPSAVRVYSTFKTRNAIYSSTESRNSGLLIGILNVLVFFIVRQYYVYLNYLIT